MWKAIHEAWYGLGNPYTGTAPLKDHDEVTSHSKNYKFANRGKIGG